jgi:hypothetical protein
MAILGIAIIVAIFFIGSRFDWSASTQIIMSLLVATATTLTEMVVSFESLKDSIETIYPALELSLEEQRTINKSIILCNELRKRDGSPAARIALAGFDRINFILLQAVNNNDYIYNDIYEANLVSLSALKPGQTFKGISALIKPQLWKNGKIMNEYKQVNYTQSRKGVIVDRIFIFNNSEEIKTMNEIMQEQSENKINVFYLLKSDVNDILHYPDFSVMEDVGVGLVVHREEMLERVTITTNQEIIGELSTQFDSLKNKAIRFEANH